MENVNSNFMLTPLGYDEEDKEDMWALSIRCETTGRWETNQVGLFLRDFDDLISVLKAEQSRVRND